VTLKSNHECLDKRASRNVLIDKALEMTPPVKCLHTQIVTIASYEDADINISIHRPVDIKEYLPVLFWMHGGGYILGWVSWI